MSKSSKMGAKEDGGGSNHNPTSIETEMVISKYTKAIEDCHKKIRVARFEQLTAICDRYKHIRQEAEAVMGKDVVKQICDELPGVLRECEIILQSEDGDGKRWRVLAAKHSASIELNEVYEKIEAAYEKPHDPACRLGFQDALTSLRESKKAQMANFDGYEEECATQESRIEDFTYTKAKVEYQEWYRTLVEEDSASTAVSGPVNTDPSNPSKGYTENNRAEFCQKTITDSQKKIIKHYQKHFEEFYADFTIFMRMASRISRGTMLQLFSSKRDLQTLCARGNPYENLPENIRSDKLATVVTDMQDRVLKLLLDFDELIMIFQRHIERSKDQDDLDDVTRGLLPQLMNDLSTKRAHNTLDVEELIERVWPEQVTIARFTAEMEKNEKEKDKNEKKEKKKKKKKEKKEEETEAREVLAKPENTLAGQKME